jgi:hypothetical protein
VDGDGDLDALYASWDPIKISWFENTAGDGSAWTEHTIAEKPGGYQFRDVFAADVDGDGDLDALAASEYNHTVYWYENSAGDGSTWSEHVVGSAQGARSVVTADFDRDGDLDVLAAAFDSGGRIHWYENTAGDGSAWNAFVIKSGATGAVSVFAADVDGDGDLDALSAAYVANTFAWYENDGTPGGLGDWTEHLISTTAGGAEAVAAADLDRDGDLDVLGAMRIDDAVGWYENTDGAGSFGALQVISDSTLGADNLFAADLDADGDLDVLSTALFGNEVAWHENDGTPGGLGDWAEHTLSTTALGARSVIAADVDADGDLDVLSASDGGGGSGDPDEVAWYENGPALLRDSTIGETRPISTTALEAISVHAADLDGDGDLDVLSASLGDDTVAWYENTDGAGSLGAEQVISNSADGAHSVFATDVDRDGDLDVLSASYYDNTVAWYENDGTPGGLGDWTPHVISDTAGGAYSVFTADLDRDGDQDVLAALGADDEIAWYENDGTPGGAGDWTERTIATLADGALFVRAADVDGDGDQDVLAAVHHLNKIAWYGAGRLLDGARDHDLGPARHVGVRSGRGR